MTEENQGAVEWLRRIIDEYEASAEGGCSGMAKRFGIDCEHAGSCRGCMTKVMTDIADRIEADRELPEGIEWPRFEDGGLVRIGDELEFAGKTMLVCDATFYADGWALWCSREGIDGRLSGSFGERVKRPTPKVLDADGVPIEVGDTVYCDDDPESLTVDSFGGAGCVFVTLAKSHNGMLYTIEPSRLSHECPDSWEKLEKDMMRGTSCRYFGGVESALECWDCPHGTEQTGTPCWKNERIDILKRAKKLAKAGEVE